jgi:hypothetical protein
MKPITIRRIDTEIREAVRELSKESDPDEAAITRRDIEQLQRMRRELMQRWLRAASTEARL